MVAQWPRLAAMRRAEAREGQPGRPSGLGCSPLLPPRGVLAAHGGLVARSASGGSERARAVAVLVDGGGDGAWVRQMCLCAVETMQHVLDVGGRAWRAMVARGGARVVA
jgi:hypothetical protein